MATTTLHPSRDAVLFGRLGAVVSDFFAAVADARRMANRYEELSRMTDSELSRLGFSREEIPQVVARGH